MSLKQIAAIKEMSKLKTVSKIVKFVSFVRSLARNRFQIMINLRNLDGSAESYGKSFYFRTKIQSFLHDWTASMCFVELKKDYKIGRQFTNLFKWMHSYRPCLSY